MWDPVPWFVGGSAQHSAETARLLAYAAFGSSQGIVSATDCAVMALATPGPQVRVMPGATCILNKAPGALHQAYACRLPTQDVVNISATGSSSGRSDLIVARVENSNASGESWAQPTDPTVGPYIYTRVISGVPAGTTDVKQVRPNDSAITLARIDIPASTGTITQAMIKDLRPMVNTQRERVMQVRTPASSIQFDSTNVWKTVIQSTVAVPAWATRCIIKADFSGMALQSADTFGQIRAGIGPSNWTQTTVYDENYLGSYSRCSYVAADDLAIAPEYRGINNAVYLQGMRTVGTGWLLCDSGTTFVIDIEFRESAAIA